MINEFGREVIERGGVANRFQCRIIASQIDEELPMANRVTVLSYTQYVGEIILGLTTYLDDKFSEEGNFADLSERPEFDYFHLEGKHELVAGDNLESHIFHFKFEICSNLNFFL